MRLDYFDHLPEEHRHAALHVLYHALQDTFAPLLGSFEDAKATLVAEMNGRKCVCAIHKSRLIGVLGFRDQSSGFWNVRLRHCCLVHGLVRGVRIWCGMSLLYHPVSDGELYIEVIAVAKGMRGQGVGSQLMELVEEIAARNHYTRLTLEVVDTNLKAQFLYERLGFQVRRERSVWPFNMLFGLTFRSSALMEKTVPSRLATSIVKDANLGIRPLVR
jgi:ribosomal protein S18 acetylase RimI-like enzyme